MQRGPARTLTGPLSFLSGKDSMNIYQILVKPIDGLSTLV